MKKSVNVGVICLGVFIFWTACSSGPKVKQQEYAKLSNKRTFENPFPTVWRGIELSLHEQKVLERDPEEPTDNSEFELRKLDRRTMETDWIYTQSRDKYVEYQVNGSPRKQYLQLRFKYLIDAQKVIGGTDVKVDVREEIEKIDKQGNPDGYDKMAEPDPGRASELLDKINQAILSAPNI